MGKWTKLSKSDSLNPGLWIVSEATQRREEGPKAVTPVCGSAWAPASVLTFVHARFCSLPINSGDSQISFQVHFLFAGRTTVAYRFLLLATEELWRKENIPLTTPLEWGAGIAIPTPSSQTGSCGSGGLNDSPQISQRGRDRAIVRSHGVDLYFRDTSLRFTWKTLFQTQRGCI